MIGKTKPLGEGTSNLTVNMPKTLKQALESLAKRSDMRIGAYCRRVLEAAAKRKLRFKVIVEDSVEL